MMIKYNTKQIYRQLMNTFENSGTPTVFHVTDKADLAVAMYGSMVADFSIQATDIIDSGLLRNAFYGKLLLNSDTSSFYTVINHEPRNVKRLARKLIRIKYKDRLWQPLKNEKSHR